MTALAENHNLSEKRTDMICIGAIFGAAGIHGAVRVKVFTEDMKSISDYGPVTLIGREFPQGREFDVKILHQVKGGVAAKLKGVNDRTLAENLKGAELYIERSALPEIKEEGDFYFEDLIGLTARDQNGNPFGHVDGVFNFGAGDIIEVKLSTEKGKRMYPFSNEVVPEVNLEEGFLVIDREAFNDGVEDTETEKRG